MQNTSVVLVIEDDGKGFDTGSINSSQPNHGIGLISIRERVEAFGGTLTIDSSKSSGTEIIVEIPCRKV